MIYILWGEDEFSIEETLQTIKSGCGDISLLSTNTNVFDGLKLTVNELNSVGGAMPFLSPKRLVIVRGLLARFEAKDKSAKPKKSSGATSKPDEAGLWVNCVASFPESTVLVLIDSIEMKKNALQNNPLFQGISNKADVRSFPPMNRTKLSQWLQARITQRSGSISHQAANLLMEIIGGDLFTMTNEINKLVAFTGGRMIEEKDVRAVVSASQEADVFAMVDVIMDRQAGTAEQLLQKLLQNGIAPQQILVLLARQVQLLVQLKDLKSRKIPVAEIQSKLGLFNPYVWNKISARGEKYTLERLKQIYRRILDTDLAIKTGRFDGDLALNILVADLCLP